jgi:hypothetical protein
MIILAGTDKHKWQFKTRFRRHAFGWRSQPAIQRVKEAVAEIKSVARKDLVLAAGGAVALIERLSPALRRSSTWTAPRAPSARR